MTDNVVKLTPRPRKVPALFFEITLGDGCMELSLHDSTGCVGTLKYDLTAITPPDFDMDRLDTEWDRLREPPEDVA